MSTDCKTYNNDGSCSSCYKGYDLRNGTCSLSESNTRNPSDLGCGRWDWDNNVCLSCSKNWVFNTNRNCVAVNDQCAKFN